MDATDCPNAATAPISGRRWLVLFLSPVPVPIPVGIAGPPVRSSPAALLNSALRGSIGYSGQLPDSNTLFWRAIFALSRANGECFIPQIHISCRADGAKALGGVWISEGLGPDVLIACFAAICLCAREE